MTPTPDITADLAEALRKTAAVLWVVEQCLLSESQRQQRYRIGFCQKLTIAEVIGGAKAVLGRLGTMPAGATERAAEADTSRSPQSGDGEQAKPATGALSGSQEAGNEATTFKAMFEAGLEDAVEDFGEIIRAHQEQRSQAAWTDQDGGRDGQ